MVGYLLLNLIIRVLKPRLILLTANFSDLQRERMVEFCPHKTLEDLKLNVQQLKESRQSKERL